MQLRAFCKSKIHRAIVTDGNLSYVGSIAIDSYLLELANIAPGEKVAVWDVTNGERIETYALAAPAHSGQIVVNGAGAHKIKKGDTIIVAAFVLTDEVITPHMIMVDEKNTFEAWLEGGILEERPVQDFLAAD
jgi:aspartate 1-decarboxylase